MKARIISIFLIVVMALTLIPVAAYSQDEPPDPVPAAAPVVDCSSIRLGTDRVEIKCTAAGIIVLDTTVDLPTNTITLPPIIQAGPTATVTVRVPGPSSTETIRVPVPVPTQTATVTVTQSGDAEPIPGPTSTVTVRPNGTVVTPTATVTQTATVTATETTTGQAEVPSGTVDPSPSDEPDDNILFEFPDPTTVKGATIGGLALLGLVALILLAMFGGYYMGYRDSDVATAKWMKRILEK